MIANTTCFLGCLSRASWVVFIGLTSILFNTHAWGAMYKCTDDSGRIIYSDSPCRPPPPPKQMIKTSPTPTPAPTAKSVEPSPPVLSTLGFNQTANGKLSEALAAEITRKAMDLGPVHDFRSQCALAASDIKFHLTDQSSRPATVVSGGRKEICELQRESAMVMQAAQLQQRIDVGKMNISVNSAATQAIVQFEPVTFLSMQGQVMLRMRCTRKDTLAVYQDQVLYKDVISVCKPF